MSARALCNGSREYYKLWWGGKEDSNPEIECDVSWVYYLFIVPDSIYIEIRFEFVWSWFADCILEGKLFVLSKWGNKRYKQKKNL